MNQKKRDTRHLRVLTNERRPETSSRFQALFDSWDREKAFKETVKNSKPGTYPAYVEHLYRTFGRRGRRLRDAAYNRRMYDSFQFLAKMDFYFSEMPLWQCEHVLVALRDLLDAAEGYTEEARAAAPVEEAQKPKKKAA